MCLYIDLHHGLNSFSENMLKYHEILNTRWFGAQFFDFFWFKPKLFLVQNGRKIQTQPMPKFDTNSRKIQLFDPSPKKNDAFEIRNGCLLATQFLMAI